ncbi:MAG: hypothetical protein KAJ19_24235 [Gammaproteobacteria bacterium]|nr:hypothetical protein [Gammaproteobacteria bacterium]
MSNRKSSAATGTFGFGAALAINISWGLNHSIGLAIWHGLLNWWYVIYHWLIGVY